ncbi:MAG: DNA repair protein RadA [Endomicrobiales bacterium]
MKKSKIKSVFRCQECGYSSAKWMGKCPDCGKWNTFVEEIQAAEPSVRHVRQLTDFSSEAVAIDDVSIAACERVSTGIGEFDRMIGGGIVPGSLVLLGGAPGIGKSTLMLQVSAALSRTARVLYISGEESLSQVKTRADRLGVRSVNLFLVSETNLENMLAAVEKTGPQYIVVDSIQTTYRADLSSAPGSVGQIRECAAEFLRLAKSKAMTVFLLGHVTKEGDIAGPRVLEHIVDTVLYFETERQQVFRILRAYKNRFGPTSEIGVFEMRSTGLCEITNPSQLFLGERSLNAPGSIVTTTMEGTRPLLLEVQSLVTRTNFGFPKRMVTGYDAGRVTILIAVLEKRIGLNLETQDVFVNVVGGLKIKETGIDLATACAIASAHSGFVCPAKCVVVGEVGLAGEVRSIAMLAERLGEAEKLGFEKAIVPQSNLRHINYKGKMNVLGVDSVDDAIAKIRQ